MPRLFNRPRNMPRFFQGRMFNRLTGQRAPRLYSGARPRRFAHGFFKTQVSPYGAGGGGRRQYSTGGTGHSGNVIRQHAAQAQSGRGMNFGLLHHTPGYLGTRMAASFRQDQAKIKRDYKKKIREQKKLMRGEGANKNAIRAELARLRGQHRVDRRSAAASWSKKNRGLSPRFGINVRQNPYTGRRFNTGFTFRRQQGSQQAHLKRAQKRNMRITERFKGQRLDARLYGIPDKNRNRMSAAAGQGTQRTAAGRRGVLPQQGGGQQGGGQQGGGGGQGGGFGKYAYAPTHADFTRGSRRQGFIRGYQGHWNRGRNRGRVMRPHTMGGTTFLPGGRTIRRNDSGQLATGMSGSFRIPQTNRAMTAYEMSRMGSARGPHPQRRRANRRQFNPNYHDYRASRFE